MTRKKVATTIYITSDQDRLLKLLSQTTGMPMAELIRQGIDFILEKYRDRLPTQLGLFGEPPPARPPASEAPGAAAASDLVSPAPMPAPTKSPKQRRPQ